MNNLKRFFKIYKSHLLKMSLMIIPLAGLIGYEHGLLRGLFVFISILVLVTLCMLFPFIHDRKKYGDNPFE